MSWIVNIDEIVNVSTYLIVRVTLSDGTQKVKPDEYHVRTELELKEKINADIDRLSSTAIEFPKLVTGPYDPSIAPPVTDPAREAYASDIAVLGQYDRAIALKVVNSNDADYTAQLQKVIDGFKSPYLDLF